jgi:hypothetical protein
MYWTIAAAGCKKFLPILNKIARMHKKCINVKTFVNGLLKKSLHGLFQPKLAKVNFANISKGFAFAACAFRRTVLSHANRLFFKSLLTGR